MNRAATAVAVLVAAAALLSGCGDSSSGGDPAGGPVTDAGCTAEILRQLRNPSQTTKDIPPQCVGIADARLAELANVAASQLVSASPSAPPN